MTIWTTEPGLAQPANITLASTSDSGIKGNHDSGNSSLSADGTKVAFESSSTNLDPADTDTLPDIYVKDLLTGDLTLASTSDAGVKGNDWSVLPHMSGDGTKVAFASFATNLDPADTDTLEDVYVKDLLTGDLTLASTSDAGVKGNDWSLFPRLSFKGARVAFNSIARNLDPGDRDDFFDTYVKDLTSGDIILASTSDSGVKGNQESIAPSISADGTVVAFDSLASNLDRGDRDSTRDTYVKNLVTGDITLASTSDSGVKGNGMSYRPSLSADGTIVAFNSTATNLDPVDHDSYDDIYVKDITAEDLILASTSDEGVKGDSFSFLPSLSADGNKVGFYSAAKNLDPGDPDQISDVYVKDVGTGDIRLASTSDDELKGNGGSFYSVLSGEGMTAAFQSTATNLDPADTDSIVDIYVKELGVAEPAEITVRGHAHTDYSDDGEPGPGDVHIATNVASAGAGAPTGQVRYSELRPDPPGDPAHPFRCLGTPTSVEQFTARSVLIRGAVSCTTLGRAATFSLFIADHGRNPPAQDAYHMKLYDSSGAVIYNAGDLTTVSQGDLVVRAG